MKTHITLQSYLEDIPVLMASAAQKEWFKKLSGVVDRQMSNYQKLNADEKAHVWQEFNNRARTEEIKAWYSAPENGSLFQGTSVSSLTIPYELEEPLEFKSVEDLENEIVKAYIQLHRRHVCKMKNAIQENVDDWVSQGLYYGVVIGSKVISQAFDLTVNNSDVILDIQGTRADPHEITSYPQKIREEYFKKCLEKITCFAGLDLEQREFESSLVLADISKPKIKKYKDRLMLAPVRCNEIATVMSRRVVEKIKKISGGRICPKSLAVIIYDSDTPYTYHNIMGYDARLLSPTLPGLTLLGSSGTIDAFRWLYVYRVSLVAQKMQKGSVYSQVHKNFIPFAFFGVLVWRDAEILLDMNALSMLRYRGNIAPDVEFLYLIANLAPALGMKSGFDLNQFMKKHHLE